MILFTDYSVIDGDATKQFGQIWETLFNYSQLLNESKKYLRKK